MALQGLPGWRCVLLRPLKNQPPPSPFLFPFQFASLHFLLVTSVSGGVSSGLATLCSQADATPPLPAVSKQLAQSLRPSLPWEAAVGSREGEHGWMHRGGDRCGLLSVTSMREPLSPALHLGLFMKWLLHSKQCHTPGLGSPSDVRVQDLPPTCNVALAIVPLCLGFLGTSAGGPTSRGCVMG